MIRRQPIEDDDENPERWLVSYADFITLLFAFFVVMYAISSVNVNKYSALTNSMGSAFTGKSSTTAPDQGVIKNQPSSVIKPLPLSYIYQKRSKREQESMKKVGVALANQLATQINSGQLNVLQTNRGIRIDISDSVLFASGSSTLAPSSASVLVAIANVIKRNQRTVQIEGHTDSTPIHTANIYSNWELSALRATTVVRMMIQHGIAENRLSAVGYGSTLPISTSDTDFGRAANRRVSVLILYDSKTSTEEPTKIKPQGNPVNINATPANQ